ncbi:nucleotidyltransferase family protein [Rubrivivax sp. JA1024]|nr:nucleotidyltransferase family protein [Rubrivivax sp. JA1024]
MAPSLLVRVLREPARAAALAPAGWDLLVRQARRANLIARLHDALAEAGVQAPPPAQAHLAAARQIADAQRQRMRWELACIAEALAGVTPHCVVLKGGAYLALDLPLARSRLYGDLDILVPRAALADVESALLIHGWIVEGLSAYDEQYYRRWMHELPPMRHRSRETALDVHHTLLPLTSRTALDTLALFDDLRPLAAWPGLSTLAPADLLLHSATHLFHEGEFAHGLRDLFDLDALVRHFGGEAAYWDRVVERAGRLGLRRSLHYALRHSARALGTPVPPEVQRELQRAAPPWPLPALLDACYARALQPQHPSCETPGAPPARLALYLRSHWLRMPLPLLARHLARKAWRRFSGAERREQEAAQRQQA